MLSVCKIWYWLSSLLLMIQNDVLRTDPANWKRSEFPYLLCQSKRFRKQGSCLSPLKLFLAVLWVLGDPSCCPAPALDSGPARAAFTQFSSGAAGINIWAVAQAEHFQKTLLECRKAWSSLCMELPRAQSVSRRDPCEGTAAGPGWSCQDLPWALHTQPHSPQLLLRGNDASSGRTCLPSPNQGR